MLVSILRDVEALLLPTACLGCERAGAVLCDQCRMALRPLAEPRCQRCGQTKDRWEETGQCGFCLTWPDALAWADSGFWFEPPARELVHALKYGGWTIASEPMARALDKRLRAKLARADALIPVPLGRLRRRERGHNQAEALARWLGRLGGIPVRDALARTKETLTQTALHPLERRANVEGAFMVRGERSAVSGKDVILIDDVLTTGATLGAAAEALKAAGARTVGAVTFARAIKPE